MIFRQVVEIIEHKSPFQKKILQPYLSQQDEGFWGMAEFFTQCWLNIMQTWGLTIEDMAEFYLKVCKDTLREQIAFMRTGRYRMSDFTSACRQVYENEQAMLSYMIGLGLSQFLWQNHYKMLRFFQKEYLSSFYPDMSYLEIGPGHGLFLQLAASKLEACNITAIDISKTSLQVSKSLINATIDRSMKDRITFLHENIFNYYGNSAVERITMGEVLEHIEHPEEILVKISQLLHPQKGAAFITTCANCPAIDHIYHFRSIEEIRALISSSKLQIVKDVALPLPDIKITIDGEELQGNNYAAVVRPA